MFGNAWAKLLCQLAEAADGRRLIARWAQGLDVGAALQDEVEVGEVHDKVGLHATAEGADKVAGHGHERVAVNVPVTEVLAFVSSTDTTFAWVAF